MVPQASGTSSSAITMPKVATLEGDPGRTRQHPSTGRPRWPRGGRRGGTPRDLVDELQLLGRRSVQGRAGEDLDPPSRRNRPASPATRVRTASATSSLPAAHPWARPQADSGPAAGPAGRSLQFAAEAVVDQLCRARRSRGSTLTRFLGAVVSQIDARRPRRRVGRAQARTLRFGLNSAVRTREGDGRWGSTAAAEDGGLRSSTGTPSAPDDGYPHRPRPATLADCGFWERSQ